MPSPKQASKHESKNYENTWWEKPRPQPHFCFFFLLIPTNWEPGTGLTWKLWDLWIYRLIPYFAQNTTPDATLMSQTHLIKQWECTWPNNSTAATLTGILELTRNELPCWRTKWDTGHEWTSSLKDLNNIHTQPIDESHWKFLRGEKDLIKTYYQ